MTLALALRLTEMLVALALLQRSAEHLARPLGWDLPLHGTQGICAAVLLSGVAPAPTCVVLCSALVAQLWRYNGPYNGGSDKMIFLVVLCLTVAHATPNPQIAELAMGYLALQLILSYGASGWVKLRQAPWRQGTALVDVFRYSAYPVSEGMRRWANRPVLLRSVSWAVIGFELLVPVALMSTAALTLALCAAVVFHGANAMLLGLNRFVFAWISAFPSALWLGGRLDILAHGP